MINKRGTIFSIDLKWIDRIESMFHMMKHRFILILLHHLLRQIPSIRFW